MRRVFIAFSHRTPVTPRYGAAKSIPFYSLAAPVLQALESDVRAFNQSINIQNPWKLHSVIAGNALGSGGNPARLMSLAAGLPNALPALSVDSQCCSGLDAIGLAYERLKGLPSESGHQVVLAGGAESASQAPIRMNRETNEIYEQAPFTPWPDRDPNMIEAALALEKEREIPKDRMVDWALRSHRLSLEDRDKSLSLIPSAQGVLQDTLPRVLSERLIERATQLGRYNPFLMAPLADGAAFSAILSFDHHLLEGSYNSPYDDALSKSKEWSFMEILDYVQAGANPVLPGLSCEALDPWLKKAERRLRFSRSELLVALMESFSSQVLTNLNDLRLLDAQVNPWGGLLARGHPIGASGAILVWDLHKRLEPGQAGLAAIPAAGGLASGLLVKKL